MSACVVLVVACGRGKGDEATGPGADASSSVATATNWPASLKPVGTGFPNPGDPCRVVGETPATVDLLDDSATLVGCVDKADAAKLGGKELKAIDGVTLVSVPLRASRPGDGDSRADAKVAGTDFNATAQIRCSRNKAAPGLCNAGIKRGASVDHGSIIEVSWPGGGDRTLFFDAKGAFLTANGNEADGSAGYATKVVRRGDAQIIDYGPEHFEVPDAFVLGD